jgi:hypothetical protein
LCIPQDYIKNLLEQRASNCNLKIKLKFGQNAKNSTHQIKFNSYYEEKPGAEHADAFLDGSVNQGM